MRFALTWLALLGAPALSAAPQFGAARAITLSADGASSVGAADLDGDGDVDVLSTSFEDEKVAWYENLGAGEFGPQRVLGTMRQPEWVDVSDLDGDRDLDVLVSSSLEGVFWYENLGAGAFGPSREVPTPSMAINSARGADLDGDGDVDVLTTSLSSMVVAWNENFGGGSFGAPQAITSTGMYAEGVNAADLDGDGDPDVLATEPFEGRLNWYENLGGGVFGGRQQIAIVFQPAYPDTVDLDGDGDLDIVVGSGSTDRVSWFPNLGGGSFGPSRLISDWVEGVRVVHAGDLDGDGLEEILSASWDDDTIAFYENEGGGSMGPQRDIDAQVGGPYDVTTADLDGDGDLDVLAAAGVGDAILWYENPGTLSVPDPGFGAERLLVDNHPTPKAVLCTDLDGDGDADALLVTWGVFTTSGVSWCENLGGAFGPARSISAAKQAQVAATGDLDGDGDIDVVGGFDIFHAGSSVDWFENLGAGVFGAARTLSEHADGSPLELRVADLDGDGDLDIATEMWTTSLSDLGWYENQGGGVFGARRHVTSSTEHFDVDLVDRDGDGDIDFLLAEYSYNNVPARILWIESLGGGAFGAAQLVSVGEGGAPVLGFDVDGDADLDIVCGGPARDGIRWFECVAPGSYVGRERVTSRTHLTEDLAAFDADGDGDPDLVSASRFDDKVAWYENLGGGRFGPQRVLSTHVEGATSVFAADVDGDFDLDVVAAGRQDNEFTWFENRHELGVAVCAGRPNSTGSPASVAVTGTQVVRANAIALTARSLPPFELATFLCSRTTAFVPGSGGSQGDLCLGGALGRFSPPLIGTGPVGRITQTLDLTSLPSPLGAVTALAGQTWAFQAWYTDSNPGPTRNFSDAVSVLLL